MESTITFPTMFIAAAILAAGLSHDKTPGAVDAIMGQFIDGEPVPPDYWPELQRVQEVLRAAMDQLEA